MKPKSHICTLCDELKGIPTGINEAYDRLIINGLNSLLVFEDYYVVPSYGSLCPGHVMLCPRDHKRSFRGVEGFKVYDAIELVRSVLEKMVSSKIVVFEHSAGIDGACRSACVDHAHLHFVPTKRRLLDYIAYPAVYVKDYYKLPSVDVGYTYLLDIDGSELVIDVNESQYLRKVWCAANGECRWNWRLHGNMEYVAETVKMFRDYIHNKNLKEDMCELP